MMSVGRGDQVTAGHLQEVAVIRDVQGEPIERGDARVERTVKHSAECRAAGVAHRATVASPL